MERRQRMVSAVVLAALLAGFAWLVLRPHGCLYRGKTVSDWLAEGAGQKVALSSPQPQAEAVMRELGTNVLPLLVEMAGTRRDYIPRMILREFANDPDLAFLHLPRQYDRPEIARWGFKVLGAESRPAVPALADLLKDKDPIVRMNAAFCLGAIGPAAAESAPALLAAWKGAAGTGWQDKRLRWSVAQALGQMGPAAWIAIPILEGDTNEVSELALLRIRGESVQPFLERLKDTSDFESWNRRLALLNGLGTNAESAVPMLLGVLGDTNRNPQTGFSVQQRCLEELGNLHCRPEMCLPVLVLWLRSTDHNLRYRALVALRRFGPAARPAAPAVARCLKDPQDWVQREATNALRAIDPDAAVKAGIKMNMR